MKVSVLLSIARQVEGEYVFVKAVKAATDAGSLYMYLSENELPKTEKVGEVDCVIEYGVIRDIEVEGT